MRIKLTAGTANPRNATVRFRAPPKSSVRILKTHGISPFSLLILGGISLESMRQLINNYLSANHGRKMPKIKQNKIN